MIRPPAHKVFISYHHANDQDYKTSLNKLNERLGVFMFESLRKLPGQVDNLKVKFPAFSSMYSWGGVKSSRASWGLSSLYSIVQK